VLTKIVKLELADVLRICTLSSNALNRSWLKVEKAGEHAKSNVFQLKTHLGTNALISDELPKEGIIMFENSKAFSGFAAPDIGEEKSSTARGWG
jgi:hypothetical protein